MVAAIESNTHSRPRRKLSSVLWLVLMVVALVAGVWQTLSYSIHNRSLSSEVKQLEAELGVMNLTDTQRVYFTAIEKPDVPAVIAEHVDRVWQYRCYFPPNYDHIRFSGNGIVESDGFFLMGSYGTGHSSAAPAAANKRMTVSVTRKQDQFELLVRVGGSSNSGRLSLRNRPNAKLEDFVIEPVLASGAQSCSFGRDEIIPLLRIYDPASAKEKIVGGRKRMTYSGTLFVLCPASQETKFEMLRKGDLIDEAHVSGDSSP